MKFLDQFETRHKGSVTNLFLSPIRAGREDVIVAVLEDFNRRKRYRPLLPHYQVVERQCIENGEDIQEFVHYYQKYNSIPKEEQKRFTNKRKRMEETLKTFDTSRPLSWSAISQWEYSKTEWFEKYVLGQKTPSNKEMEFGKRVGERLASDPAYLCCVPRLPTFEHKLQTVYNGIPLIGYMDGFCPDRNYLLEYKTGKKEWNQKRADEHGQIDMYLLMHNLITGVKPEDVRCKIVWLPTQENGDFSISFVEPVVPQIFETKRTTADILKFAKKIEKIWEKMQEYAEIYA